MDKQECLSWPPHGSSQKGEAGDPRNRLPHLSLAHLKKGGASEGRSICPLCLFGNSFSE